MTRMGRRENWESLRIFVACGRHLSFTTAAAHLGLTQAAVSQRISELERRFRVRLFSRRPRLALTPSGERLLPRIEQAFTAIDRALTELSQPRLLTITTTQSFAMLWLRSTTDPTEARPCFHWNLRRSRRRPYSRGITSARRPIWPGYRCSPTERGPSGLDRSE